MVCFRYHHQIRRSGKCDRRRFLVASPSVDVIIRLHTDVAGWNKQGHRDDNYGYQLHFSHGIFPSLKG